MRNLIKKTLITAALIFISISCENKDSVVIVEENNLMAIVTLWPNIYEQDFGYNGEVITKVVSELKYVILNEDTVFYNEPSDYYKNNYNGDIEFSLNRDEYHIPISDTVFFAINTGVGIVRGYETMPDSVRNISFNLEDTVKVGQTLVMSITGQADYFEIYYSHSYLNNDSTGIEYKSGRIYTIENEAYFDSTFFSKNGYLTIYSILVTNGPLPNFNSTPNMDGEGKGYLFIKLHKDYEKRFVIGEGY